MIQQVNIEQLIVESDQDKDNPLVGPYRVAPGRLSVSRTFGDIEAKYPDLGGMEGVVVCDPDITYIRNGGSDLDFIVIGSDGIFDKLSNSDIGDIVWNVVRENQHNINVSLHQICGKAADEILKEAAKQKSMDNISIVMIGFKPL
jgi:protein phosphatase 2C family protein 2/3